MRTKEMLEAMESLGSGPIANVSSAAGVAAAGRDEPRSDQSRKTPGLANERAPRISLG